jgi:hypothetical protein
MNKMNRISIFEHSGTHFVKQTGFTLPFDDGKLRFNIKSAMVAIGSVAVGKDWNCPLDLPTLSNYLCFLQTSQLSEDEARKQFVSQLVLRDASVPLAGKSIDWDQLRDTVEKELRSRFPLCV